MRILMLGNSFTFMNNMPQMLAEITGAEVVEFTRGGSRLAEFLNPATNMGGKTVQALENEHWDYVILQEMSNGPITARRSFAKSIRLLAEKIRFVGAVPVLYATWAYRPGAAQYKEVKMGYEEMAEAMYAACHEVAEQNNVLVADVGRKFFELSKTQDLYGEDGSHPNERGSRIAAEVIAEVIRKG